MEQPVKLLHSIGKACKMSPSCSASEPAPYDKPGEAVGCAPSNWVPATRVANLDGALSSGFSLAYTWPLCSVGE